VCGFLGGLEEVGGGGREGGREVWIEVGVGGVPRKEKMTDGTSVRKKDIWANNGK